MLLPRQFSSLVRKDANLCRSNSFAVRILQAKAGRVISLTSALTSKRNRQAFSKLCRLNNHQKNTTIPQPTVVSRPPVQQEVAGAAASISQCQQAEQVTTHLTDFSRKAPRPVTSLHALIFRTQISAVQTTTWQIPRHISVLFFIYFFLNKIDRTCIFRCIGLPWVSSVESSGLPTIYKYWYRYSLYFQNHVIVRNLDMPR